ncbi:HAD-IA family hydrolase [Paenibacillus xanthanilyticus]|uniref:HAD-IA family hydrolase n=1 Tax=Paenibacillus xanthanilyticus TaxID=1783531 RepID=A0ABV8K726_9BACL
MKPQLLLDAGGVLVSNLSPLFWEQLCEQFSIAYEAIVPHYKAAMSASLWRGEVTEAEFWDWLAGGYPGVDVSAARRLLTANLIRLPALDRLALWRVNADLHLLSNHRTEWLFPVLAPELALFTSVTISSEIGSAKPQPEIFRHAALRLPIGAPALFVDDQTHNLHAASELGWMTLKADADGRWVEQVGPMLGF